MQFFAPLISEDGVHISAGRVILWILFGFMTYFWFGTVPVPAAPIAGVALTPPGPVVPPTLMTAFQWMVVYNFGKKLLEPLNNYIAAKAT